MLENFGVVNMTLLFIVSLEDTCKLAIDKYAVDTLVVFIELLDWNTSELIIDTLGIGDEVGIVLSRSLGDVILKYVTSPSYSVQNVYTGSSLTNNSSSNTVTSLLQALIMPPKEAVLLKMLVLLIYMNIELAIIATTPPLSPALFQLNMDSSMLTWLFTCPRNNTPPSSPAELLVNWLPLML